MVIGVSGLLGIEVAENFDQPFTSRNFQEFWTRWHITLSTWIRDLVFTPLSKALMRKFGPKSANHVIAVSILISFLIVGIWHGSELNFLVFGALQGAGLVTVHYYTVWLKKKLGRRQICGLPSQRLDQSDCHYRNDVLLFLPDTVLLCTIHGSRCTLSYPVYGDLRRFQLSHVILQAFIPKAARGVPASSEDR